MKYAIILFVTTATIASTQSFDCVPPWGTNVNCQFNGDSGCSSSTTCAEGWTRWANFTCTYEDPYCGDGGCINACTGTIYQCDITCQPGFLASQQTWKPDFYRIVMNLFPHLKMEWKPIGRYGECRRVVKYV